MSAALILALLILQDTAKEEVHVAFFTPTVCRLSFNYHFENINL